MSEIGQESQETTKMPEAEGANVASPEKQQAASAPAAKIEQEQPAPLVESTGGMSKDVPLNAVIKTEQPTVADQTIVPATSTMKETPQTEIATPKTRAEQTEEYVAQIEKELVEKINAAKGAGGEALTEEEKLVFARDFYIGKLGENGLMHSIQHPDQGLVDFLKSELENKIKGKTEEVVSSAEQKPVVPQVGDASASEVPEVAVPAAKAATGEADKPVNEFPAEELIDPGKQFQGLLDSLGYTDVKGTTDYDFHTLINKEGNPIKDEKTGKPYEFKFYSDVNPFLKKKLEEINNAKPAKTISNETPKPEIPVVA